jgi:two-component system, NarL family, response regulator DesR
MRAASRTTRCCSRPSSLSSVTRTIRVVLVEDNQVFREALELLLSLQDDIEVVAAVDNGSEAAAVCEQQEPDVVVLDYRLPGLDGLQATNAVREAAPEARIVFLTASLSASEARELYAAGAVACLTKDTDLDAIIGAIRDAAHA